jgi:hypothetical protein
VEIPDGQGPGLRPVIKDDFLGKKTPLIVNEFHAFGS